MENPVISPNIDFRPNTDKRAIPAAL